MEQRVEKVGFVFAIAEMVLQDVRRGMRAK